MPSFKIHNHQYRIYLFVILTSIILSSCVTATKPELVTASTTIARIQLANCVTAVNTTIPVEEARDYSKRSCELLMDDKRHWSNTYQLSYETQLNKHQQDQSFMVGAIVTGIIVAPVLGFLGCGIKADSMNNMQRLVQSQIELKAIDEEIHEKNC